MSVFTHWCGFPVKMWCLSSRFNTELDKEWNNFVKCGANSVLCIRLNYGLSQGSLQPKWLYDFMKSKLSKSILQFIIVD